MRVAYLLSVPRKRRGMKLSNMNTEIIRRRWWKAKIDMHVPILPMEVAPVVVVPMGGSTSAVATPACERR